VNPGGTECRSCGASPLHPIVELGEGFRLGACNRCGLVSTVPELSASAVARFYPPAYYGARNRRFIAVLERLVPRFRARRADVIEREVAGRRVLDVGCGRGYLPAILRERGWDAHGIEISDQAAEHARRDLGLPVHVGTIEDSPFEDASFDAIVFWHVLEHVADPVAALRKAHALLKPNGFLLVAVPNYSSLQARFAGRHWFHLDIPRHYHHFRVEVLHRLLDENGFRILRTSHFVFEQNPFGWFQSIYNVLGFRPNLLYEMLKDESARAEAHPLRTHPIQAAAIGALLPGVGAAGLALSFLEVLLRRGGTVEVHARRLPSGNPSTASRRAP
jgi:2-polyprenyl-3-methyl-5-hydroxy-6-metoxy-1,4-benzoquinol methylase